MTEPLLTVRNLSVRYPARGARPATQAVDDISFEIAAGETLALVGGSGCGKSTVARAVLRLLEPDAGRVFFAGVDLGTRGPAPLRALRALRRRMQIVLQDPSASLTPWMTVGALVAEPLEIHQIAVGAAADRAAHGLLAEVGLSADTARRKPHELSGGQRQRVAIARALASGPDFLVLDEVASALDLTVQDQILTLLERLQRDRGLTCLFITHNLALVQRMATRMATRVAVMERGRLVETVSAVEFFLGPAHPYSRELLDAVPSYPQPIIP
jgi:ABC-type glutathione transport system ATPase component